MSVHQLLSAAICVLGVLGNGVLFASGQLATYQEVQDALLQGRMLQMTTSAQDCVLGSWSSEDETIIMTLPMRHWRILAKEDGRSTIQAADYSIIAREGLSYLIRSLEIQDDGTVTIYQDLTGTEENPAGLQCQLGEGAIVEEIESNLVINRLDSYKALEEALLAGKSVTAVGSLSSCSNEGDVFPSGVEIMHGFVVENAGFVNRGTQAELIAIFQASLDAPAPLENLSMNTMSLYVTKFGGISIQLATFGLNEDDGQFQELLAQATLTCTFEDFLFSAPEEQDISAINSYQDLKGALLYMNQEVQYQVVPALCEQIDGIGTPVELGIRYFNQFQLFQAGDTWGDQEFIALSTYTIDASGRLITDIVKVYPDGVYSLLEFGFIDLLSPNGTSSQVSGSLRCPLGDAVVFQTTQKKRDPLWSFDSVYAAVRNGSVLDVEINFDLCDGESSLAKNAIYGGVLSGVFGENDGGMQTYVFGSTSAYVNRFQTFTETSAWLSASVILYEGGTVFVQSSLMDLASGELLAGGEVLVCRLMSSAEDETASLVIYSR